jgi:hypothetical protein
MIGEADLAGVFISSVLITALLALAATWVVRRLLTLVGGYRLVWHPALFDTSLFVILWALVVALLPPL